MRFIVVSECVGRYIDGEEKGLLVGLDISAPAESGDDDVQEEQHGEFAPHVEMI